MAPWTWPEGTSAEEVVGRIKGIVDSDGTLQIVEQQDNRYFRLRAARNFNYDEIELVVNPMDRVITFRRQQVEGPEAIGNDWKTSGNASPFCRLWGPSLTAPTLGREKVWVGN
jgi:hypothetical protein